MTRFILDTDMCIYWLKGNENIEKNIVRNGRENTFITVITECELYYGAFKSGKKEKNLTVIGELKKSIGTLHTTESISRLYGKIKTDMESQGKPLDDADLLIACIALANNAVLVTNNKRHFERISELRLENWK